MILVPAPLATGVYIGYIGHEISKCGGPDSSVPYARGIKLASMEYEHMVGWYQR